MRSSEFQHIVNLVLYRPFLATCRYIVRYWKFLVTWAGWAYLSVFFVWIPTNPTIWAISAMAPLAIIVVNFPILWVRNRPNRKAMRRQRMREEITRLERELELT